MLWYTYYARNYAGIIRTGLFTLGICCILPPQIILQRDENLRGKIWEGASAFINIVNVDLIFFFFKEKFKYYLCHVRYIGERLASGIKDALVLQQDEAVVVTAEEEFDDKLPDGQWRE